MRAKHSGCGAEQVRLVGGFRAAGDEDRSFRRPAEEIPDRRDVRLPLQHLIVARRLYQQQKESEDWLFPSAAEKEEG